MPIGGRIPARPGLQSGLARDLDRLGDLGLRLGSFVKDTGGEATDTEQGEFEPRVPQPTRTNAPTTRRT